MQLPDCSVQTGDTTVTAEIGWTNVTAADCKALAAAIADKQRTRSASAEHHSTFHFQLKSHRLLGVSLPPPRWQSFKVTTTVAGDVCPLGSVAVAVHVVFLPFSSVSNRGHFTPVKSHFSLPTPSAIDFSTRSTWLSTSSEPQIAAYVMKPRKARPI